MDIILSGNQENKMQLISVIVPVYNIENYLSECIESILKQTYQNIELILVDDGSTDNSGMICEKYKKQDPRVIVIHKKNEGPSIARNLGLQISHGEYVMFVDSDDWIDKEALRTCVEIINENKCDVIQFDMCDFTENERKEYHILKGEKRVFEGKECQYLENIILRIKGENPGSVTALTGPFCKIIRKKTTEKCVFPTNITLGEDTCYVEQVLSNTLKFVYISAVFYHRRILNQSLSHMVSTDYVKRRLAYVNWTLKFYKERKQNDILNQFCYENYKATVFQFLSHQLPVKIVKRSLKEFEEGILPGYTAKGYYDEIGNWKVRMIYKLLQHRKIGLLCMLWKFRLLLSNI